ncbi:tryptophan halogenase family protein [Shewanella woodyi]|uniref:Tryptophan halogenase n=1 Tax=Shewanella woodyi (strain ATCC 51908 / MS32) TaxID=392500 RepID=B1KHC8_SHEWM|nr:tryptophan halogenase family protein [Shewanella woodyi]ACA85436.1 tryptophan halogenase [Shewanella woodyi ATCC 51908]
MHQAISNIIIVGGGTAGWITAGILAAEHNTDNGKLLTTPKLNITLIESPDIPPIGVGEGTWPSMRNTLTKIGISETQFIIECDASFKQGSRFINWHSELSAPHTPNNANDYLHPFSLPFAHQEIDLAPFWLAHQEEVSFALAVSSQDQLTQLGLAPKSISTPEYHFHNNYGYHLDAGKFSQLLMKHCTEKLGVNYISDHVVGINEHTNGDIKSVQCTQSGSVSGDLFVDCSGLKSLLLGKHYQEPFLSQKSVLFNDSALAIQIPYPEENSPIASCTLSTAQESGWIWDIGLPTRKGVGYVYSSEHASDQEAEKALLDYIGKDAYKRAKTEIRKLEIAPGYHQKCWRNNCIAIGMAAGFIEPLEASALALVEWSATTLAQQLPPNRASMELIATRVNNRYVQHWQQIIDFLKLHYVLSSRNNTPYWRDHQQTSSIPDSLQSQLEFWHYQVPCSQDIDHKDPLFPAASFQYVLYGMGFQTQKPTCIKPSMLQQAQTMFVENQKRTRSLSQTLPSNRELLDKVKQFGFPTL